MCVSKQIVSVVKGPLPVLNMAKVSPGSYEVSPSMTAQLDQAFQRPFPVTDFGDRERFPDWVVVVKPKGRDGKRWLVREPARAHIWVEVDGEGNANAWTPCTRVEARALDRAWGSKFPRALRLHIQDALRPGNVRPGDLKVVLDNAWLHLEQHHADGSGEALWSLGPPVTCAYGGTSIIA